MPGGCPDNMAADRLKRSKHNDVFILDYNDSDSETTASILITVEDVC